MNASLQMAHGETIGPPPLPPGSNPRPSGPGWQLVDSSWDESTGVARLTYRRRQDPTQRHIVEVHQPAGPQHNTWAIRPPLDRDRAMARHAETLAETRRLAAAHAYSGPPR